MRASPGLSGLCIQATPFAYERQSDRARCICIRVAGWLGHLRVAEKPPVAEERRMLLRREQAAEVSRRRMLIAQGLTCKRLLREKTRNAPRTIRTGKRAVRNKVRAVPLVL